MKKYGKTGAALLAAALLCAGGTAQAVELTVNSKDDLNGDGWTKHGSILTPTQDASGNEVIIGSGETPPNLRGIDISGGHSSTDAVSGNRVTLESGTVGYVYGGYGQLQASVLGNTVTISDGTVTGSVFGGRSSSGNVSGNRVTISGGEVQNDVYGGWSAEGEASQNTVTISDGTVTGSVYGGWSVGSASNNTVTLSGTADVSGAGLYGGGTYSGTVQNNTLVVDNWSGGKNGTTVGGLHNFESIRFTNIALDGTMELKIGENGTVTGMGDADGKLKIYLDSLAAGDYASDPKNPLIATVKWDERLGTDVTIADDLTHSTGGWVYTDREDGGLYVNQFDVKHCDIDTNQVDIFATVENSALTGKFIDENGAVHYRTGDTEENHPLVIGDDFTTNVDTVAGAYAVGGQNATGGQLRIEGDYDGTVYAGYSENGAVKDNNVYLDNTQAGSLHLLGRNEGSTGGSGNNTLHVTGTGNTIGSVANFDALSFDNLTWEDGATVLSITGETKENQLSGTEVSVNGLSLAGGTPLSAGQSMTLLESKQDMGLGDAGKIPLNGADDFTAGVAAVGKGTMAISEDGKQLTYTIDRVGLNPQTTAIAENRTAAAAFLNQGADIAADSLDLLGSDYKYGLRTFGAVYGSRSTYDAAGDLKINGWSEIVGLGDVHRKGDGDLSWGVFYENGTGNYRTWNEFNNEMFRGDGSLLYNGGGAAVRYQKDNGWYYEASVRAGTLSASMDNAVKDGKGNSYGFDSDSTYWGAHAGVGKVIETEQGEWNVYGKYFHTDIDGDSFHIDGDRFEFDSLTSDRLRLGARYTADKAKQWSLYYGLAWEYEFTGDSHMRAAGMNAPEQSLGGSTGIAEIGTVWQPSDSPWQANINLKGYAGEREGVSGMVQLAYTF